MPLSFKPAADRTVTLRCRYPHEWRLLAHPDCQTIAGWAFTPLMVTLHFHHGSRRGVQRQSDAPTAHLSAMPNDTVPYPDALSANHLAHPARAPAVCLYGIEATLFITRRNAVFFRHDPDLIQMQTLGAAWVVLRVTDTRTALIMDSPAENLLFIAHAVLVLNGTFQHVGQNFHIFMRVSTGLPCFNHVVVNHAQRGETHKVRVVVVGEKVCQESASHDLHDQFICFCVSRSFVFAP